MYHRHIETNARHAAQHNEGMRAAAKARLERNRAMAHFTNRPPANPNRKQAAKLNGRRLDYTTMTAKPRADNWSGYHRPGSNS